jgi:hypothetical protein
MLGHAAIQGSEPTATIAISSIVTPHPRREGNCSMAAHDVTFEVPARPLGKKDLVFVVSKNRAKFGELRISRGAVVWIPADKTKGRRLSWLQMDKLAQEHGTAIRVSF